MSLRLKQKDTQQLACVPCTIDRLHSETLEKARQILTQKHG